MSDITQIVVVHNARAYTEAYPNDWPATHHIRGLLAIITGLRAEIAALRADEREEGETP